MTYTSTANTKTKMDDTRVNGVNPGVSVRMGPVDDAMDIDAPAATNGTKRRKSSMNGKTYKDASESDDDDIPLVRHTNHYLCIIV